MFRSRDPAALPAARAALAKEQRCRRQARPDRGARGVPRCRMPSAAEAGRLAAIETLRGARRPRGAGDPARTFADDARRQSREGRRRGGGRATSSGGSRVVGRAAEHLVRHLPRLGAAAGRHRPRHHLRRDGRHQHGAWRDGDARRLHDLRRAGDLSATCLPAGLDWSLAIALPLAFLVAGAVGLADRARHHPLPLRPAAGDAARHLGRLADPAAGGAHHLRPDQPRGRQPRPGCPARSSSAS